MTELLERLTRRYPCLQCGARAVKVQTLFLERVLDQDDAFVRTQRFLWLSCREGHTWSVRPDAIEDGAAVAH